MNYHDVTHERERVIHPTIRIVATAQREGCPDSVAPAVAAAVLRTAASEIAHRGAALDMLCRWAGEIEGDQPEANTSATDLSPRARRELDALAQVRGPRRAEAILISHRRLDIKGCLCGWADLGKSHAGHQVAMLREAGLLAQDETESTP